MQYFRQMCESRVFALYVDRKPVIFALMQKQEKFPLKNFYYILYPSLLRIYLICTAREVLLLIVYREFWKFNFRHLAFSMAMSSAVNAGMNDGKRKLKELLLATKAHTKEYGD